MAKNKKKHSSTFIQQQQKLRQAQSRNLFENKMRSVCELIGDKSLYDVIPITQRTIMYLWRGTPLTVEIAKGTTEAQAKALAEKMEPVLRRYLDKDTIELIPGSGKKISLNDYFWAVVPMEKILKNPDSEYFPGKELFHPFMKSIDKRYDEYLNRVSGHARMFCKMFDDLSENLLFAAKHEHSVKALEKGNRMNDDDDLSPISMIDILKRDYRLRQTIVVTVMHVDEKQLTVDGETLLAKQLGMVSYAEPDSPCIMPFHATPKQLKLTNADKNLQIPVYFTDQLFNDIFEYAGCSMASYSALYLRLSVFKGVYIPLSDNTFLMEYRMMDHKIGYVVAELTNDILLLRSFRLVTHSSTPEGAKLQELAKEHEEYKNFLLIDNLRPIIEYGLINHNIISRIFCKAGCKPLMDFCRQILEEQNIAFFNPFEKDKRSPTFSFDLTMKGYSELSNKEEEFFM
jgi:hypothetical protein